MEQNLICLHTPRILWKLERIQNKKCGTVVAVLQNYLKSRFAPVIVVYATVFYFYLQVLITRYSRFRNAKWTEFQRLRCILQICSSLCKFPVNYYSVLMLRFSRCSQSSMFQYVKTDIVSGFSIDLFVKHDLIF